MDEHSGHIYFPRALEPTRLSSAQESIDMTRRILLALSIVAAFSAGTWRAQAQAKEPHPVLARAIEQINAVRGRLQSAPRDFGGHKQKAIDALNIANDELRQARQFDK